MLRHGGPESDRESPPLAEWFKILRPEGFVRRSDSEGRVVSIQVSAATNAGLMSIRNWASTLL